MTIQLIALILSVLMFLLVLDLVRREKLTFKYAAAWLFIAAIGVFFSLFPEILFTISFSLGFELPSNFIFFSLLGAFVFLSLVLTVFLCQQNSRNDRLAQTMGLMDLQIRKLKEGLGQQND